MILAAVMSIGLVSYGVAEPISHYMVPPHGTAEPETMDAAIRAMQFSYLDWGFQAWAIFGVFGLAIGYSTHRKGRPALVSTMLRPVLGRLVDGWIGNFIDILTIIATLFGTTTSLGLGASQIGQGLNTVLGVDSTLVLQIIVIGVLTLLFTGSALTGVSRGIKYISQITLTMATLLGLFVFITGPSGFVSNLFVRSVGAFAGDFLERGIHLSPQAPQRGPRHGRSTATISRLPGCTRGPATPFAGTVFGRPTRTRSRYGTGPVPTALCNSRKNTKPRYLDALRLNRKMNSSKYSCRCSAAPEP
jgi:choline-glycine betaine transporter